MQQLGYQPVKATAKEYRYLSPFRSEETPSFHVTLDGRAWKDFGDGRGGNIIDLAFRLATKLSLPPRLDREQLKMALAFMQTVVGSTAYKHSSMIRSWLPVSKEPAFTILEHHPFRVYGHGSFLTKASLYLGTRGINAERFAPYLEEVIYSGEDGKKRYGFGIPNVSGGYELRRHGDWKKTAVGHKDVTIFKAAKEAAPWHTFYSLIDFGTFLSVDKPPIGAYHYLIINSDSLVDKAIGYLDSLPAGHMIQYPHLDESGQRAYQKLLDFLMRQEWGIGERSHLYLGFKDWTEAREAQLGLTYSIASLLPLKKTPKID
nr:CHC2 zinc finger domain-containing protein [Spirosoma liriopis]